MTSDFETRLIDWAKWFHENKGRIPPEDLRKRVDFLQKSVDGCLELIALAALQMRSQKASSQLYLPNGMRVTGDLTRFG